MPLFEVNARHARIQSGAEALGFVPLVQKDQKAEWESYTKQNQWWIEESRGLELDDDDADKDVFKGSDEQEDTDDDQLNLSHMNVPIFDFIFELDSNELPTPVRARRIGIIWEDTLSKGSHPLNFFCDVSQVSDDHEVRRRQFFVFVAVYHFVWVSHVSTSCSLYE